MKKRLSLILALSVLIPSLMQAGGKKFHEQHQAIQEINHFLHDDFAEIQDKATFIQCYDEEKQEILKNFTKLTPNQRGFYSRKLQERKQQLLNQRWPRDLKLERFEREERNRINHERNRAQLNNVQTRNTAHKKKKEKTIKQKVASWVIKQFTQNPLRTLLFLGGVAAGGYKLWQFVSTYFANNNQQQQQNNNEHIQCLRCQQGKPINQIVQLECTHSFCGNCLHRWTGTNHPRRRECPVLNCTQHLCGNQCRKSAHNDQSCDNHIEPLQVRINAARTDLNNNRQNQNQNGINQGQLNNNQTRQPGVADMLLRMATNTFMRSFGF